MLLVLLEPTADGNSRRTPGTDADHPRVACGARMRCGREFACYQIDCLLFRHSATSSTLTSLNGTL
jgi:hypothetical protein